MISFWHKKAQYAFLQFSKPNTTTTTIYTMSSSSSSSNNNNNNGRSHNRYVVLVVGLSATGSKIPIPIGGYRPSAAIAARNSGRKAPIHHATAPVARVSPPVASSNIPSAGASNSSCNSAPAERTSGYIRCGRIVPLPKVDKLRKAPSHGPSCARIMWADPAEVQRFRASLKASNNSPLVSGNFPPLVPSHFLKTPDDARKNAGLSFSSIAAKDVKPGAKFRSDLRHLRFLLGMRLGQKMRIGFLYRRVRKTYYGGDLGVGSMPNFRGHYGKEFVKLMRWHQEMAHLEIFGWV
jgi:hypothetical protein